MDKWSRLLFCAREFEFEAPISPGVLGIFRVGSGHSTVVPTQLLGAGARECRSLL